MMPALPILAGRPRTRRSAHGARRTQGDCAPPGTAVLDPSFGVKESPLKRTDLKDLCGRGQCRSLIGA